MPAMTSLDAVQKLEAELFTPALQQAAQRAREQGSDKSDTLYAASNAYLSMLVSFVGDKKVAVDFLQQQIDYLQGQPH